MFWDSWSDLLRVFAVGAPAYVALVLLLRVSGKRTLSKLNAFDFVVTVAMGSTLATILLSKDVSFVEGVAALALLVGLQFVITWTSIRWSIVHKAIKAEPTLLYYGDRFLRDALVRERVTRAEVLAAVRDQGYADIAEVGAIVLETDGSLTVLPPGGATGTSTLETVRNVPDDTSRAGTESRHERDSGE